MKKSDLKTGMKVELRNEAIDGKCYDVFLDNGIEDCISQAGRNTGWMPLDDYNDDMIHPDSRFDIVKVYKTRRCAKLGNTYNDLQGFDLIWERNPKRDIDVTVRVNGKEVPLTEISEETLLNIRNNS